MSPCCENEIEAVVDAHEGEPASALSTKSDALFATIFIKYSDLPLTLFDDLLSIIRYLDFCASDVTFQSIAEGVNCTEELKRVTFSDALLAMVFDEHRLPRPPASFRNDLLSLFQHSEFHDGDITMREADDIVAHIADSMRTIAHEREREYFQRGEQSPVPALVIELVAEELESQRRPFHATVRRTSPFSEIDRTLRNMCLVHSSWTTAARQSFRRRICVDEIKLRSLLLSPQLGPWVRELALRPYNMWRLPVSKHVGVDHWYHTGQSASVLCEILKRCPNITHLHLQDFDRNSKRSLKRIRFTEKIPADGDIFQQLRYMQSLKHLWLHCPTKRFGIELWDLCMVLPQLRLLESLSLENIGARFKDYGQHNVSQLIEESSPSPTLTSLSLMIMPTYDKGPLKWLTHPRSGFKLKKLEVRHIINPGFNYNHKFKKRLNYLSPASHPHIEELRVIDFRGESDFASAIEPLTSLRTLSLCMLRFQTLPADPPLELPASVRDLHIHLLGDPMDSEHARAIVGLLVASPHLRRLSITCTLIVREPPDGRKPDVCTLDAEEIQIAFVNVIQHCSENNICFVSDVEEPIYDYLDSDL